MQESKQRNGWLTAFLILMIVANTGTILVYLFSGDSIRAASPGMPAWATPVLIAIALFNLACAVALFKWKRWGFWGLCASGAVTFLVNLMIGVGFMTAAIGLIGVAVLYGVLQIGRDSQGWAQLD